MPTIRLAIVVEARRELHLWAGEAARDDLGKPEFEHMEEPLVTLDGTAFMKVGLATVGSVYLHGAEVVNHRYPQDSLALSWYLPDEEGPEAARPIDLLTVGVLPAAYPRDRSAPGQVWRFRVEARGPVSETLFFQSGFQPPFKPSDLTMHLVDLAAYGFDSMVLGRLLYCHRAPVYAEAELGLTELISEGLLED